MAEVLGIIASSVQVAGLAGQIAGIGLKIRALYQELQDVPEELSFRLQELQLLSEILSRSNSVSSDARSLCERCLPELGLVLAELETNVKKSRGIRKKVASTKVVLKKQLIQKLDYRLCRSIQLLQLAANSQMASNYGVILQNQDAMMSLLKTHFNQAREPVAPVSTATIGASCTELLPTDIGGVRPRSYNSSEIFPDDSKMWCLFRPIKNVSRAWTFGLPFITGTIHFESNDCLDRYDGSPKNDYLRTKDNNTNGPPTIWASFSLPRWLSYRVLEAAAQRSRIGWKQFIRMRNVFPRLNDDPCTPFHKACEHIAFGDLQSLRKQIDEREVTPWDEDGRGETMWATALYYSKWDICNYFMDLGAEPSPDVPVHRELQTFFLEDIVGAEDNYTMFTSATRRSTEAERRNLMGRLDDDDGLRLSLLSGFEGTFDEFASLKSSIWPNHRFYRPEFSQQRMQLAVSIACAKTNTMAAPSMIRSVLELDNVESRPSLDFSICNGFRKTIFHGLASRIATTAGSQNSADWHRLTCDILTHVTDIRVLARGSDAMYPLGFIETGQRTALRSLIFESIYTGSQLCHKGLKRPSAVMSFCEKSVVAWLEDLYKSGIDLEEYGSNEKSCQLASPIHDVDTVPSVFSHSPGSFAFHDDYCLVRSLRLIDFEYGSLPTDWKFWWDEPSDEFAGDFWRLVELESTIMVRSMPGAWFD